MELEPPVLRQWVSFKSSESHDGKQESKFFKTIQKTGFTTQPQIETSKSTITPEEISKLPEEVAEVAIFLKTPDFDVKKAGLSQFEDLEVAPEKLKYILPLVLQLLREELPSTKLLIIKSLRKVIATSTGNKKAFQEVNGLKLVFELLLSTDKELLETTIFSISSLVSPETSEEFAKTGVVSIILKFINDSSIPEEWRTELITNLHVISANSSTARNQLLLNGIPTLFELIKMKSEENTFIQEQALSIVSNIALQSTQSQIAIQKEKTFPILIDIMNSKSLTPMPTEAAKAIAALIKDNDTNKKILEDEGFLKKLIAITVENHVRLYMLL